MMFYSASVLGFPRQGPVSVAVYAPGDDFNATVNTILYLRDCWAEGIKKYVTFHLFFHVNHTPKKVRWSSRSREEEWNAIRFS